MSSISQTIPSYVAGISEQPDQLKLSGQVKDCVNALPDVTRMLGKRPGCEFLREDTGNDAHKGKWFDIYRDPTEQYIGSVRENGTVDVFRVVDAPLRTYKDTNGVNDVEERFYTVLANTNTSATQFQPNTEYTNRPTINTTAAAENPQRNATGLTVNFKTNADSKVEYVEINRVGNNNYKADDVLEIEVTTPAALDSFSPAIATSNFVGGVTNIFPPENTSGVVRSIVNPILQGNPSDFNASNISTSPNTTLGGSSGTGLTVNIAYTSSSGALTLTINNPGQNYASGDNLLVDLSSGANPLNQPNVTKIAFQVEQNTGIYDFNVGNFTNIATTGGSGSGLTVDVVLQSNNRINSIAVNNPGSGYTANDSITLNSSFSDGLGTHANEITFDVDSIENWSNATDVSTTSTGNGVGLTVDVTVDTNNALESILINTPGTGYADNDVITILGGSNRPDITCQINGLLSGFTSTFFTGLAGEQCNVKYDDVSHQINDLNKTGTTLPTTADTNCEYLEHTDSDRIKSLTVNDTTAFVNKDTVTAMTNATEPASENEGFMEITVLAFNQIYQYNIIQNATTYEVAIQATHATDATVEDILDDFVTATNAEGFLTTKIGNGLHIRAAEAGSAVTITNTATATNGHYPANTTLTNIDTTTNDVTVEVTTTSTGDIPENGFTILTGGTDLSVNDTLTILGDSLGGNTPADDITLTVTAVGTGNTAFSLETPERQLMNVFTDEVQDITLLPDQCHHHYRVKVANSGSEADDYYVRFSGANNTDGQGIWEEWRKPTIKTTINAATMPHIMFRQSDGSFLVCPTEYEERKVGDDITNPLPSFIGNKINNVTLYRNRLGFLSNQNLILSRPGDFFNFFVATALAITAKDPIDISAASPKPATLFDAIEVNTGLILFSRSQQFMLTTDNDILSAETAKINFVSSFNYNENVSPFSLGTTIGFLNDEGSNTRLYEMSNPPREGQPEVIEQSKIVSNLYPTGIDRIATSKNNAVVLTAVNGTPDIFGYRYYNTTERRLQSAWFKLRMSGDVIYHTIIRDTYWAVIRNLDTVPNTDVNIVTIQKMELKQNDGTVTVNNATQGIICYLDNKREIPHADLTYNAGNDETTFTLPWTYDQTKFNATTFETGLTVFQLGDGEDGRVVDLVSAGGTPARINTIDDTNFQTVTLRGRWDEQTDIAITNAAAGTNLGTGKFTGLGTTGGSGTGLLLAGEVDIYGDLINVQIVNPGSGYTTGDVVTIEASVGVATTATCTLTITEQSLFVGYAYEMDVQFPVIYPVKGEGDSARSDVQGSLIIHRFKVNTNSTGTFQMELGRKYRDTFSTTHEAKTFDSYTADAIAIGDVDETVVACYDRNTNVDLHLKSSYPLPVTLISMTWEGEYTNKNYRRA